MRPACTMCSPACRRYICSQPSSHGCASSRYTRSSASSVLLRALGGLLVHFRYVWNVFTECGCQIDLMFLFLDQDLANLLRHRVFPERVALPHPLAVGAHRVVLVLQIGAQHLLGV